MPDLYCWESAGNGNKGDPMNEEAPSKQPRPAKPAPSVRTQSCDHCECPCAECRNCGAAVRNIPHDDEAAPSVTTAPQVICGCEWEADASSLRQQLREAQQELHDTYTRELDLEEKFTKQCTEMESLRAQLAAKEGK